MNTDKHWELHAISNPYWAVVTWDQFKGNIDERPEILNEFFQTGRDHVNDIFSVISTALCSDFTPKNALDFGCGVGRLLVPLAHRGLAVTGVDVSATMLSLAKKHLTSRGFSPVDLTPSLELLPEGNRYDLVHSFIVLQHIPVKRGVTIIKELLNRVSSSGVIVFHVTYSSPEESFPRAYQYLVNTLKSMILRIRGLPFLFRVIRGRNINPPMLMENYPLNTVFSLLEAAQFNNIHIRHSQHERHRGLVVFAQRNQDLPHPHSF